MNLPKVQSYRYPCNMDVIIRELRGDKLEKTLKCEEIEALAKSNPSETIRELIFISSNKFKLAELRQMIDKNLASVEFCKIEVPEIQDSNVLNIVQQKCIAAFKELNKSTHPISERPSKQRIVLIEDVSLGLRALNGMPGPYVKWFWEAIGCEGLYKVLSGYEDKGAEATCTYALMENEDYIIFCRGSISGQIVSPIGESWGWDPCFKEDRSGKTFGQMDEEMKSKFSHRARAVSMLNKLLAIDDFGKLCVSREQKKI